MTKDMKISMMILAALMVISAVLLAVNYNSVKANTPEQGSLVISVGDEKYTVTTEEIKEAGLQEISTNYKPSGKAATTRVYGGVPFADLLEAMQINTNGFGSLIFTAADGYASAVTMEEAMDPQLCAIVTELDGSPLLPKEKGGEGPFMMIMPKDKFSQRWCKYLTEITVQK